MKLKIYILFCLTFYSVWGYSQGDPAPFRFWQLTSLSGQVMIRGNYNQSEYTAYDVTTRQTDAFINGIVQVKTRSFFVHPNFMDVTLNAIYSPETRRDNYVGIPDYTETTNSGGFNFSALFLKKKPLNFTTSASSNNIIQNIDNITRLKTKSKQYGASFNYSNKILPFSASYSNMNIEQQTIGSDRKFKLDQQIIQATASRSITSFNQNTFTYYHTENKSSQTDSSAVNYQNITALNTIDNFQLIDDVAFDRKRNFTFNSTINDNDERGSYDFKRLQANERLICVLPKNFTFSSSYFYDVSQQNLYKVVSQGAQAALTHQLYKSLRTRVFYEYNETKQENTFNQARNRYGIDLMYTKKIIWDGTLNLNYNYAHENQRILTIAPDLAAVREEYTLIDGQIILLRRPAININSIIVRNASGSIIYQLNIDYELITHGTYIEIRRILTSPFLLNNTAVYVDYTAAQGGTSKYDMNANSVYGSVSVLKNLFNVYGSYTHQNYNNISVTEINALNYYTRYVIGARIEYKFARAGAEYTYYTSSIVPYEGMSYYIALQKTYRSLTLSLNGNVVDYQMTDENSRRQDIIISTKVAYAITRSLRADVDYSYRTMNTRNTTVDYQTSKVMLTYSYLKFFISGGANFYWNSNNTYKTNFRGLFIQLTRNF